MARNICKCRFEYGYYITKKKLTQRVIMGIILGAIQLGFSIGSKQKK